MRTNAKQLSRNWAAGRYLHPESAQEFFFKDELQGSEPLGGKNLEVEGKPHQVWASHSNSDWGVMGCVNLNP